MGGTLGLADLVGCLQGGSGEEEGTTSPPRVRSLREPSWRENILE